MNPRQSGNILFLILIAVALFAALSYAITSSTRSSGGNASKESAQASASRLDNFASSIKMAILKLETIKGVKIYNLQFNNDIYKTIAGALTMGALGNPSDPSLYLFHPEGGGITPLVFSDISNPCPTCSNGSLKPGHVGFKWINIPDMGTSNTDATVIVTALTDAVCDEVNKRHAINLTPTLNASFATLEGSTTVPSQPAVTGATTADLDAIKGRFTFCYKESSGGLRNIFVHVLEAN